MTMQECYREMGGDYADVSARLSKPGLIERFVGLFLEDKSFAELCRQMEAGSCREAFRAAHTLEGVCSNLGFARLLNSTARLTAELREESEEIPETALALLEEVRRDYRDTTAAIQRYMETR